MSESGYEADVEPSEDDRAQSSYTRRRKPQYDQSESSVGEFDMTEQGQRRGRRFWAESLGSGRLSEDLPLYKSMTDQCPGGADPDAGCVAPIRRAHSKFQVKDKEWKFVWPRDQNPRHGRWGYWDRIKDLATGKGPDIWIEELHSNGPHHPVWTGWKTAGYQHPADTRVRWTNLGCEFRQDLEWLSPIKAARREDGKKYDHKTRRYRMAGPGMWSDVIRSDTKSGGPWYFRDEIGRERVDPQVDGGYFHAGWGQNPFFGRPH